MIKWWSISLIVSIASFIFAVISCLIDDLIILKYFIKDETHWIHQLGAGVPVILGIVSSITLTLAFILGVLGF